MKEDLVYLKGHIVVDFEIFIKIKPSPIKRLLAFWSPVHDDPGLVLMVEVYVGLKFGENSILDDYITLGRPANSDSSRLWARWVVVIRSEVKYLSS